MFQSMHEALEYVGRLSEPSKMPGFAFGTPAWECKLGVILHGIKGTVCSGCYALKGRYPMPTHKAAQYRRFHAMRKPHFEDAMVYILTRSRSKRRLWMRWFDSGSTQGKHDVALIMRIAKRSPETKHWVPIRDYDHLLDYVKEGGEIPRNVVVRMSAHKLQGKAPDFRIPRVKQSTVDGPGFPCPSMDQGHECGECRACWDARVKCVSYRKH